MTPEYTLIRAKRKTVSLSVNEGGAVVRAPRLMPKADIDLFVAAHAKWVEKRMRELAARTEPTEAEEKQLRALAGAVLPALTRRYSEQMGLHPARVKITFAKTRFGSCAADGGICYSWRVMLYPLEAAQYVVVHELSHLKHRDHSAAFHAAVAAVLPDHISRRALLRRPPEDAAAAIARWNEILPHIL